MYSKEDIGSLRDNLIDVINERGTFGESPEAEVMAQLYRILMIYTKEDDIKREIETWYCKKELTNILFCDPEDIPLYLTNDYNPVALWRINYLNNC